MNYSGSYLYNFSKFLVKNKNKKFKKKSPQDLIIKEYYFLGGQYGDKYKLEGGRILKFLGGDKMLLKNNANYYSEIIKKNEKKILNFAEVGVLFGSSLALFSYLLPKANIFGLDINLKNFVNNLSYLKKRGAFKRKPRLIEFNQLNPNNEILLKNFRKNKIDLLIDDGMHTDDSIIITLKALYEHLNNKFIYIIEDNLSCKDAVINFLKEKKCSFKFKIIKKSLKEKLIEIYGIK